MAQAEALCHRSGDSLKVQPGQSWHCPPPALLVQMWETACIGFMVKLTTLKAAPRPLTELTVVA